MQTPLSVTLTTKHHQTLFYVGLALLAFLLLGSEYTFASEGSGGGLPYEPWLVSLRNSVTGPVAFTLSIVGIVGAGAALILGGDMNGFLRALIFLVLVMSLLVGVQNLMSTFFGRGAEIASLGEALIHQAKIVIVRAV